MSEPQQPPAAHLPATPQYPAAPPQYPASPPYPPAAPQHPVAPGALLPGPVPPPSPAREGNPLGVAAFVIAMATLAVNLFSSLARPFVYGGDGGFEIMLALDNGIGFLSFFAYALALVLGLIAVRRSASRLLTGIAIGIAGAGAIGLMFTGLTIALFPYL